MLISLQVKNLALIDECEIFFQEGLNILSGETGAGKSIIIGSINLALGAKAGKELIRTGAEYALVELVFQVNNEYTRKLIKDMDLCIEEDGILIIQRKIMDNKTLCKVGGESVGLRQCRELATLLIQIYGQHEYQTLLDKKNYLEIIDSFADKRINDVKNSIKKIFFDLNNCLSKLDELAIDENEKNREIELITYEINEIEDVDIKIGEDTLVEKEYRRMTNSNCIRESFSNAYNKIAGSEGINDLIGVTAKSLIAASKYDEEVLEFVELSNEVEELTCELERRMRDYFDSIEYNEKEFIECERRLNTINHLKSKYGDSVEKIYEYKDRIATRLQSLYDIEANRNELASRCDELRGELDNYCYDANMLRNNAKCVLENEFINSLMELNFIQVNFEINITKKANPDINGYDEVEFMISTNVGEQLRPISKVASGGELSRMMLALKTIMADKGYINTFVFDEIDAGVSGKTAWKLASKLANLASGSQIICITHLPQIASMADYHLKIEKYVKEDKTIVGINPLSEDEQINEIARLLGSDEITDTSILNAEELKKRANEIKYANNL